MKIRLFAAAISGLFLFAFHGNAQTTDTRSLSSFDKIAVSGGFETLILKEGSSESVTIEATGINADKIKTEVHGGTLEIGMKRGNHGHYKAKITVTYRSLKEIANSGSTDIEAVSVIKGERFEFAGSGSGDFKGSFDVDKLEIAISGSSDMKLNGKAQKQEIAISGSGDVDASGLKGKEASVAISGSGDVKLNVDGPVRSSVSGSGNVSNN
ncbi:MAG: DUF2807 domain-containing protein [Saprospiraceae bacterium]|nr:DUF2807 domain-containing protein [Saprospiraceae bacterium]MCB0573203.1 DUF2807 domain-containing protein [Saprospiraceae bacterium]MCB9307386.1 DUF2807 domain-containing protein [Lewinellaceae bacterium]MCB9355834.1 DUF2807 domain-containing protein [Lewinellaceae bacterium]